MFRASNEHVFPENRNEIKEKNQVNLPCSPRLKLEQVQEREADITDSFGMQQRSGINFSETAGSNEAVLQHTEDFVERREGPTTRLDTTTARSLHNGL